MDTSTAQLEKAINLQDLLQSCTRYIFPPHIIFHIVVNIALKSSTLLIHCSDIVRYLQNQHMHTQYTHRYGLHASYMFRRLNHYCPRV